MRSGGRRPAGAAGRVVGWPAPARPHPVLGQSEHEDYLTEYDVFCDVPVARGASRFAQALNKAPASVIIIDRAMIEASGAMEVPDLFRLLPGFQVYTPAYSHPVMNYHTLPESFPSRLEVKIDGRSAYEPFTNTVFWITQGLELEDIDYIEVVRGSNVPAYGANAINGSVNIVTKSPLETSGVTLRGEAGSRDTANVSAGYSRTLDNLGFRVSGRYRSNDGFPRYEGEPVDDNSEAASLSFKLLWAPTLADSVNLQLGYTDTEFTFDQGSSKRGTVGDLRVGKSNPGYVHVDWQHQFNDRHSMKLRASHSRYEIDAVESEALLSEIIGIMPDQVFPGLEDFVVVQGIEGGYSRRYDLELSHTGSVGEQLKFNWGGAARRDEAKSQLHFSQNSPVSEQYYRVFGNTEYTPVEWLTLNFGASVEHSESIGSHPSYRVSGNFHLDANNTLRLAVNSATRAPTVLDAHYYRTVHSKGTVYDLDLISDPQIEEEQRDSVELGYFGYFYEGKLSLDIKLFSERNENLIDIQSDRDYQGPLSVDNSVTYRTNSLESDDQGVEAYLRWRPGPRWLVTGQYTYLSIDAEHFRVINPDSSRDRDDAVARNMFGLMLNYEFGGGFQGAANYYYQSAIDWKSAPPVDSYDRLDLNLRKRFTWGGMKGRLEFLAQNVFGSDYTDYNYFHQFDTRYYLRLLTEF